MISYYFFFFNDTATTEIYTLSLHDALPIWCGPGEANECVTRACDRLQSSLVDCLEQIVTLPEDDRAPCLHLPRSEEHTSELQSRQYLVCRLLLEKKKKHISTLLTQLIRSQL